MGYFLFAGYSAANRPHAAAVVDRRDKRTDRRTDGPTDTGSYIDPVPHSMQSEPMRFKKLGYSGTEIGH